MSLSIFKLPALLLTLFLSASMAVTTHAAGGDDSDSAWGSEQKTGTNLKPVNRLLKKKKYEKAIKSLNALRKKDADNADIFNLLGFSHRKLGKYDQAYDYYQQALKLDPEHKGAHEYLGELFIETDRLPKAKQQLAKLKSICSTRCAEYKTLKKAIGAFEKGEVASTEW